MHRYILHHTMGQTNAQTFLYPAMKTVGTLLICVPAMYPARSLEIAAMTLISIALILYPYTIPP